MGFISFSKHDFKDYFKFFFLCNFKYDFKDLSGKLYSSYS